MLATGKPSDGNLVRYLFSLHSKLTRRDSLLVIGKQNIFLIMTHISLFFPLRKVVEVISSNVLMCFMFSLASIVRRVLFH